MAFASSTLDPCTLRDLFRFLPEAVVVADPDRRILYVNPAAEDLFGWDAAELLGEETKVLYASPVTFREQGRKRFSAAAGDRPEPTQVAYRRRDGATFRGDTTGGPVRCDQGTIQGFVGIIRVASAEDVEMDALQRLHSITVDPRLDHAERLQALLALGGDHLSLPLAIQSRVVGDTYTVERCRDPSGALQPGAEFSLAGTYCAFTVAADAPLGFHHAGRSEVRAHPCYASFGLEAYLGCPIRVRGAPYGTLNFSRAEAVRPFTRNQLAFVRLLADWIGQSIEQRDAEQELERLARTDALTGLMNRRATMESLAWQLAHANRSRLPLSIVMCDLDHFKSVNDTWGHDGGDDVLKGFAATASGIAREVDRCGRIGGEEFVFLLPDTDSAGARAFAERLLETVKATSVAVGTRGIQRVSVSLGVATAGPHETVEGLLARADRALYSAKETGRARLCMAS